MASEELMAYMAGQDNNCSGSNGWGGGIDGIIGLAALGLIFGGGNGSLFGGGRGQAATQADLAAGFNNSAVLSSLNDIKLGQASAINYNNQGFTGLNTALMSGFHGVDNAVCTLGYNVQGGFNSLSHQLSDCCCDNRAAIADLKYTIGSEFCALGNAVNTQTRDINDTIRNGFARMEAQANARYIAELERKLNNCDRDAALQGLGNFLLSEIRPCPKPAYITCNPYAASWGSNNGCGC